MKLTELFYIHLFNDYSGSPRVFKDAIDSSIGEGNRHLITSSHPGFLDGVDCNRINTFYARSSNKLLVLFYYLISQITLFFLTSYLLCKSRLKGNNPSIVVNTLMPFGALLAGKFFARKVTCYVHETSIKPFLLKFFLRFCVENLSTNVIFVSHYLFSNEKFSKPKQTVIHNGLRSDFFPLVPINQIKKFENKSLLFVGSLKKFKGIDQLILLAHRLPDFDVVAVLNCTKAECDNYFDSKDLPDNFKIEIRPKNIGQIYSNSFCVLNLSLPELWVETFGLSLLEGMAYGCPVVGPTIGGHTEFVNDENGLLIDARETESLAKYILCLSSSFSYWKDYSDNALKMASKFTTKNYQNDIKSYFSTESKLYS